ncbi:hypothetical protein DPEC_G00316780 [Dallia pectoralis]|uniref:Uncharacterized protein n=1 Tax=Dallia pectoralis TaxID=75939 RepID=A0ACC2FD39_DALPE|nr:hypothetical protein DPEC_G00316780 [Dallia pectoralis]
MVPPLPQINGTQAGPGPDSSVSSPSYGLGFPPLGTDHAPGLLVLAFLHPAGTLVHQAQMGPLIIRPPLPWSCD